jgi:hypothetical protein
MPYPVSAHATISGPTEILQEIAATGFDLNTLYPMPSHEGINVEGWRYVYWGTAEELADISIEYVPGETSMTISFSSADEMPFSIFLFIVNKYPVLDIRVDYNKNNYESVGHMFNEGNICTMEFTTPIFYCECSIREFAETSRWFNADVYFKALADKGIQMSSGGCQNKLHSTVKTRGYNEHLDNIRGIVGRHFRTVIE